MQDPEISEAMRRADSDAGRQLFQLFQRTDPDLLRQAMEQAASGHYDQAKETMASLLSSQEAQRLLEELRR